MSSPVHGAPADQEQMREMRARAKRLRGEGKHRDARYLEDALDLFIDQQAECEALRAQVEQLTEALEQAPCECYDVPTLAPTDNPRQVECARCKALGASA